MKVGPRSSCLARLSLLVRSSIGCIGIVGGGEVNVMSYHLRRAGAAGLRQGWAGHHLIQEEATEILVSATGVLAVRFHLIPGGLDH
jgi:hypothetical protein